MLGEFWPKECHQRPYTWKGSFIRIKLYQTAENLFVFTNFFIHFAFLPSFVNFISVKHTSLLSILTKAFQRQLHISNQNKYETESRNHQHKKEEVDRHGCLSCCWIIVVNIMKMKLRRRRSRCDLKRILLSFHHS